MIAAAIADVVVVGDAVLPLGVPLGIIGLVGVIGPVDARNNTQKLNV